MKKYIIVVLSIIIVFQLIYYFNPQFRFFPAKKTEKMKNVSSMDALLLKGWKEQVAFLENIKVDNNILSLDNTFGPAKDGFFNYINRTDVIIYKKSMSVELQLKKTKGERISVNLATSIPENKSDWWTMERGIEIQVIEDRDLYLNYFVNDRKNKDELYYVGILPDDEFIVLDFEEDGTVPVKDREGNELGVAIFDKNPFEGISSFYLGLAAASNSALEISHFRILTPNE